MKSESEENVEDESSRKSVGLIFLESIPSSLFLEVFIGQGFRVRHINMLDLYHYRMYGDVFDGTKIFMTRQILSFILT